MELYNKSGEKKLDRETERTPNLQPLGTLSLNILTQPHPEKKKRHIPNIVHIYLTFITVSIATVGF